MKLLWILLFYLCPRASNNIPNKEKNDVTYSCYAEVFRNFWYMYCENPEFQLPAFSADLPLSNSRCEMASIFSSVFNMTFPQTVKNATFVDGSFVKAANFTEVLNDCLEESVYHYRGVYLSVYYFKSEEAFEFDSKATHLGNFTLVKIHGAEANISTLELRRWSINDISEDAFFEVESLTELVVSGNNLISVSNSTFQHLLGLRFLDISNNKLQNLENGSFQAMNDLEILDLSGNQLTGFPEISETRMTMLNLSRNNLGVNENQKLLIFSFPKSAGVDFSLDLSHNELKHVPSIPFPHVCYIDLSHNRVKEIPEYSFEHNLRLHTLNLSHNDIQDMSARAFSGLSMLSELDLSYNKIQLINYQTFRNIPSIRILKISYNRLYFISNALNQETLPRLTELYADGNRLTTLTEWKFPRTLTVLSFRHNSLETLPTDLVYFISDKEDFDLYFGHNNETCGCEKEDFKNVLLRDGEAGKVVDKADILCRNFATIPLHAVPNSVLCASRILHYVTGLVGTLVTVFLFAALYYKYKRLILPVMYIHLPWLFDLVWGEEDLDDDKEFDAFIAYSSSDREVMQQMLVELEERSPFYRICIHERDWKAGYFVEENIQQSVQASRRTIVVLSEAFLASEWINNELAAVYAHMMEERKDRLIVVKLGELRSMEAIAENLRPLVTQKTYLEWGDSLFWERLKYVLPHKKLRTQETLSANEFRST